MVKQRVVVRGKSKLKKILLRVLIVIVVIGVIIAGIFVLGIRAGGSKGEKVVLENPLKNIVFENTNENGEVNRDAVIERAVIEFNTNYINYLLLSLGVGKLHKSYVGYGNPIIEFDLEGDLWGSEVIEGRLQTRKGEIDEEDLIIRMGKKEAVFALLSPDISGFLKDSVSNGNTGIELVAGKIELGSKGYLSMYKDLTGKEADVEEDE